MSSSTPNAPNAPNEHRILLLRPALVADLATGEDETPGTRHAEGSHSSEDAARHYLKFMLPSIPITAFILTFVLCDVLLGLQSVAVASAAHIVAPHENPALPLAAAAVVSATTGALCMWIYFGYLRITPREHATR
ncbi:MAG: hypothetical protein ACRDHP_01380 [Ktedonobacterales bacterium]